MKGFQVEIDLQALPPGVTINQLAVNQVWWVDKRTSLYRLYSYGGVYDPVTRQIITTTPIQTAINGVVVSGVPASGQSLVATSTSGATWTIISGGTTVSGSYLPISGGTISGNLTVASGLTVSGSLSVASEVDSGTMTVGGNLTVTGTSTLIGNATFSGNANVSGTLTVRGAATLNGTAIPLSSTLLYSGGPLGTPSSATLTNASGLPVGGINAGVTGSVLYSTSSGSVAWNAGSSTTGAILYNFAGVPTWSAGVGVTGNVLQANSSSIPTWVPIGTSNNKYLTANLSLSATTATGVVSITGTSTGTYYVTGQALVAYTSSASTVDIWFGTTSGSVTGGLASSSTNVNSTTTYAAVNFSTTASIVSGTVYWLNAYATGACTLRYLSVSESIVNATGLTTFRIV
jgi:cytoskeletal protein CcmA (bactofilin family)